MLLQENQRTQRILGEVAYGPYGPQMPYYPPGPPGTLRRVVQYPMAPGPMPQPAYGVIRPRMPEMVLGSDFRKVSGISSEMFRQIEAVEKQYDPTTAQLMADAERRGEMVIRLLDPRALGPAGTDAGRKYLSGSVDGQTVQFVEIIKSPGQTLGLYIREGDGVRTSEGVFISRIAPESPIYSSGVLKVGDEVLAVNLVDVRRMSLDDVVIVMSIPRRLVLTIRSHLYRPGINSATSTLRGQQFAQCEEQRPPVVIVKKELEEEPYCADDLNSTRDSETGQLLHARMKGLPIHVPPVAVPLDGEESIYEEAAAYYNAQRPPMRPGLRPMSRARDDTYVTLYQKAADGRNIFRGPLGVVTNQPHSLQRVYPRTLDNLADHAYGYTSDGGPLGLKRPMPLSRSMIRPASALGHRTHFLDDIGTGSLRRPPHRIGSASGLLGDDLYDYARPLSRSSLRTPTGLSLASMEDIRRRRFDDLRASLSTHGLSALRRRAQLMTDGSVSDTETSAKHLLKQRHAAKYGPRLSGRSSVTDALRSSSLPRHRPGSAMSMTDHRYKHGKRSHSRQGLLGVKFDTRTGQPRLGYDDDSDGAVSEVL